MSGIQNIKEIENVFKNTGKTDRELLVLKKKCEDCLKQENNKKISSIIYTVITAIGSVLGSDWLLKISVSKEGILITAYIIIYLFLTSCLMTPILLIIGYNRKLNLYPEEYRQVELILMCIDNYFKNKI